MAAADWCRNTKFEGKLHFPPVLSMDNEDQNEALKALRSWDGDPDDESAAEVFTFVFQKRKDYEKFCTTLVDERNYKVFTKFEEQD